MTGLTAILLLVALATLVATGARHWRVPAPSPPGGVGVANVQPADPECINAKRDYGAAGS